MPSDIFTEVSVQNQLQLTFATGLVAVFVEAGQPAFGADLFQVGEWFHLQEFRHELAKLRFHDAQIDVIPDRNALLMFAQ